jgi:two-component system, NarL family, nitrate/nitrite response regulator NarL
MVQSAGIVVNRPLTERGGTRVLLLEDQALIRAGMRALIEASEPGAVVREAGSYDEAVACLEATSPDVAFLDIDLKSARTGLDVLAHIRARGLSTRTIVLSANGEAAFVLNALRMGASGYIVKDMDGDGLFRRALDTVFQGGVFLPADIFGREDATAAAAPASLDTIGVKGRALEVLYSICQGFSNQLIAEKMNLAESTVANDYNTRLFRQFRVASRAALIVEVARRGIIPPPPPSLGGNISG